LSLTDLFGSIGNPRYLWTRTCPYRVPDGATALLVDVFPKSAQFLHQYVQNLALNSATAGPFTHFNTFLVNAYSYKTTENLTII